LKQDAGGRRRKVIETQGRARGRARPGPLGEAAWLLPSDPLGGCLQVFRDLLLSTHPPRQQD
jgi:hypothetical protein